MVEYITPAPANVPAIMATETPAALSAEMLDAVKDMFLRDQDVRNNSRELYGRHIALFFDWILSRGLDVSKITRADIIRYKEDLLRDHAPLTVASYLVTVRRFFAWTEGIKLYPNVAKDVKSPRRKQEFIKEDLTDYNEKTGAWDTSKVTALLEFRPRTFAARLRHYFDVGTLRFAYD